MTRLTQSKAQSPSEVRLVEVLDAYLAAAQEGNAPPRDVLLAEYPELAEDLEACLASLEFIRQASLTAPPLAVDEKAVARIEGETESGIGELGDFRLIAEVGRGGMGVVYEAVQRSLNRRVALKVLPFAAAMDPTQLRRFQTEALAAAQLHHTHIVPVYSVGCERGVHYYAMQFIDGQTLAQAIAERRRLEEPPPVRRASGSSSTRGEGGPEGRMRGERAQARHRSAGTRSVGADPADRRSLFVWRGSPDPAGMPDRRSPASGGAGDEGRPSVTERAATLRVPGDPRPTNDPAAPADRRSPACDTPFEPRPQTVRSATPASARTREYCRATAALGIQAAEALDHAHKVGIVHRDIKPANLLLDVQGNLWVTDFGLARLQDDAGLTITGDLLGTLRYMSPEQALAKRGYLDHRTDIYSLGATLYELVTLRPAIEGQDRQEVLRKIAHDEPIPPRRLNPSIPRELETILLKAMNKEPELRYTTAQGLADDLRRFLDDKPIEAKQPTWFEHVVKWSRRHRSIMATAGASIGLSMILSVVGLAFGNLRIQAEKKRADEEKGRAEVSFRKARDVVDRMFTKAAEDLADVPRTDQVRRALLLEALEFYQGFIKERGLDPAVRYETARACLRVASIYQLPTLGVGQPHQGEPAARQAIALLEQLASELPNKPEYRRDLADGHALLALSYLFMNRADESVAERHKELELREKLLSEFPTSPEYHRRLARAHVDLGNAIIEAERFHEAETHHRRALAILKEFRGDHPPTGLEDLDDEAHIRHWLGRGLIANDRWREAEEELRRALNLREKLAVSEPRSPGYLAGLAHIQVDVGNVLDHYGEPAKAVPLYRKAIDIHSRLLEDFPSVGEHGRRLSLAYELLSDSLFALGRSAEAEDALRHSIAVCAKMFADRPGERVFFRNLSHLYCKLGALLHEMGRHEDAVGAYQRGITEAEKLRAETPNPVEAHAILAAVLALCPEPLVRDPDAAIRSARKAVELAPRVSLYWNFLGIAQYRAGDCNAAIAALEHAMELDSAADAGRWLFLAMAYWRKDDKSEARKWYDKAVAGMEQNDAASEAPLGLRAGTAATLAIARPRSMSARRLLRLRAEAAALLGVTDQPKLAGKKEESPRRESKP